MATAHRFSPVYERMADEYNSIPFIAESGYPSKEVVLDQKPDLIVGWGLSLQRMRLVQLTTGMNEECIPT